MRKKVLSLILALSMLMTVMPVIVSAETSGECGAEGSDVRWEYSDGTLTISGTGTIGNYYKQHWWDNNAPWYDFKSDITDIVIEDGITDLGIYAFGDCYNVTSVTIPDSVTDLGERTFYNCSSLGSIDIPNSVTSLSNYVFGNCRSLISIDIPETVTLIYQGVFSGCTGLTSIDIPDSVTAIGESVFERCSSLESINLSKNLTQIYSYAFANCTNLTNIKLPNSITMMGQSVFSGCTSLTDVNLPALDVVPAYIFSGCTALKSIDIPESAIEIYMNAFSGCTGLTSVEIPDSVMLIGQGAFSNCTNLENIKFPKNLIDIYNDVFSGCTSLTSIEIPDGVTELGNNMFSGCSNLTRVKIPASISIGSNIFSNCNSLTTIDYAGSKSDWKKIDGRDGISSEIAINFNGSGSSYATSGKCGKNMTWDFDGVTLTISGTGKMTDYDLSHMPWQALKTKIRRVVIEDGVTEVADGAFAYCHKLVTATLPKTLTSISKFMFFNSSPRSVVIPSSVTSIGDNAFGNLGYRRIEIPDSVESIGKDAIIVYDDYYNAKKVYYTGSEEQWQSIQGSESIASKNIEYNSNLPNETSGECCNVTWTLDSNGTLTVRGDDQMGGGGSNLDWDWYHYVDKIKKIVIADGITSIGYWAFTDCINATSVTIPNSVTYIPIGSFENCCSLERITIPDSVGGSIGIDAFKGCIKLKEIKLSKDTTRFIGSTFSGCNSLKSITIPTGVEAICYDMFYGCSSLESIKIPNSVTEIEDAAFAGCTSLKKLEIPVSVTSIGENVFLPYDGLADIYYPGSKTQWEAIEGSSDIPSSITVHYNSHMPVQATSGTIGGLTWSLVKGILKIEGTGEMTNFESASKTPWYGISNNIERIEIADGVTSIGENAFSDCVSLMSVSIPKSVTSIEANAFDECFNLNEIHYAGTLDEWNEIETNDNNFDDIELCHQIPLTTPTVTKSETDSTWSFEVTVEKAYKNSYVFAAAYDSNNCLIDLNKVDLDMTGSTTVTLDKSPDTAMIKIFVWTNRLQPITTAAEYKF